MNFLWLSDKLLVDSGVNEKSEDKNKPIFHNVAQKRKHDELCNKIDCNFKINFEFNKWYKL